MNIAIFSGGTFVLPHEDQYKKHLLLFGYEAKTKKSILLKITNFQHHILVLPNQEDTNIYANENYLNYVSDQFNLENKTKISKIEVCLKMPTLSFSGERKDSLLKFFFRNENDRFGVKTSIESKKKIGSIRLELILHSKVSPLTQFLHEQNLQLQTWVTIENFNFLADEVSSCKNINIDVFKNQLQICNDEEQLKNTINPNLIFIRVYAFSSLATKNNFCYPNSKLKDDTITHIAYQINYETTKCLTISDFENNEKSLLELFGLILQRKNIQIIVFGSDELVTPNAMEYLTTRAELLNADFSFSSIKNFKVYTNEFPNNAGRDLIHPGIERIDLIKQLKRAQVNPPMVGFTLLEAIRHKNLISGKNRENKYENENEKFNLMLDPNFTSPNHLNATEKDIADFLQLNVCILSRIMKEKGFLANILTLSKENDLHIKSVVERGQQKRVFGNVMYDFDHNDLYLDEQNAGKNPVIVSKLRSESSYADPPWLINPDIQSFIPPEERQVFKKNLFGGDKYKQENSGKQKVKKKTTKGYGGGLVLDPMPGLYTLTRFAVPTNDWKSMYPNLIIAYNLCIMRSIFDSKWLTDPDVELEYIPRNDHKCDVLVKKYKGKDPITFIPRVIKRFLNLREVARGKKNNATNKDDKIAFAMAEMALKASANSVYGFFGCLTSDIVSIQFASCVTQLGQFMQKTVRYQILLAGGAVIYGDTDSCFTMYPVSFDLKDPKEIIAKIKEKAIEVTVRCSKIFYPSEIIVENIKSPLLLTNKKKTYISIEDNGKVAPKGLGLLKRDKSEFARNMALYLAEKVIRGTMKSNTDVCLWLHTELLKLPPRAIVTDSMALSPFVLSAELGAEYKSDDMALSLELASLYEKESGQKPLPGDRMSYVVAFFSDERKHNKKVLPPMTFLRGGYKLDMKWYIEKQIFSCLKQILCLPIHKDLLFAVKKKCDSHVLRFTCQHESNIFFKKLKTM